MLNVVHSTSKRAPGSARAVLGLVLAGAGVLAAGIGCANKVPPSGGPPDRSPPSVVGTRPRLFETSVPLDAPLRVVFSERMDRGSAEDGIVVRPHVDWGRRTWEEDTLSLEPATGWQPETTYTVVLRATMQDRRRNRVTEPGLVVFSTGDEAHLGRAGGTLVRLGGLSAPVLVLAFDRRIADTTDVNIYDAVSIAEPDAEGRFLVPGLAPGRAYEIGAFHDGNENRDWDARSDLYCRVLTPVVPDSGGGPLDLSIALVYPDEPGRIQGTVRDTTCSALVTLRQRRRARTDSLFAAQDSLRTAKTVLSARADSLYGQLVAPIDEAAGDDAPRRGARIDSLRAVADSLRARSDAVSVPDSASIAASRMLDPRARIDSVYCACPIRVRFWSEVDTTRLSDEIQGGAGDYTMSPVTPGPYAGLVWRDLDRDGRYAWETEPGVSDTLRLWVGPGQAAVPDTLSIQRPESFMPDVSDSSAAPSGATGSEPTGESDAP